MKNYHCFFSNDSLALNSKKSVSLKIILRKNKMSFKSSSSCIDTTTLVLTGVFHCFLHQQWQTTTTTIIILYIYRTTIYVFLCLVVQFDSFNFLYSKVPLCSHTYINKSYSQTYIKICLFRKKYSSTKIWDQSIIAQISLSDLFQRYIVLLGIKHRTEMYLVQIIEINPKF